MQVKGEMHFSKVLQATITNFLVTKQHNLNAAVHFQKNWYIHHQMVQFKDKSSVKLSLCLTKNSMKTYQRLN
jgi:hypothetical protein